MPTQYNIETRTVTRMGVPVRVRAIEFLPGTGAIDPGALAEDLGVPTRAIYAALSTAVSAVLAAEDTANLLRSASQK